MLGPLIAAGANLVGGIMGQNAQREAAARQEAIAERNIELQKEFAQSGIQWKVQDAAKAGVHPLYALGASTTSFAPVSVGTPSGSPMGEGIARMGQDLSRAVTSTSNATQRATSFSNAMSGLQLENQSLQNDYLRSQIARLKAQTGPPLPTAGGNPWTIPGQGDSITTGDLNQIIKSDPLKYTPTAPNSPSQEPAPQPDVGYGRTLTGYAPIPGKEFKDRTEDMGPLPWIWFMRNVLLPNVGLNHNPPKNVPIGSDEEWYYHPYQEYRVKKKGSWGW